MKLKRLLFLCLVAGIVTLLLRAYVFEGIYVASASMEPSLPVGTHLFLEKVSLKCRAPRRGDIVVFRSPISEDKDLIKRIIALPGEDIEIRNKDVFINGRQLEEKYVRHTRANEMLEGDNLGPLSVPARQLFVMGDNRDESGDSRDWKNGQGEHLYFVPIEQIKGRIIELF